MGTGTRAAFYAARERMSYAAFVVRRTQRSVTCEHSPLNNHHLPVYKRYNFFARAFYTTTLSFTIH